MTENNGREAEKDNDLFFTCSLIDYIARKTQNTRADVVNMLGAEKVEKIYDLADIYHSDNIERVSDDFIREAGIRNGEFDNVNECNYAIPSHWDIGKVYKRLIKAVAEHEKIVKERIEDGANEKAALRLFSNCPFVCINFDFSWLNKVRPVSFHIWSFNLLAFTQSLTQNGVKYIFLC